MYADFGGTTPLPLLTVFATSYAGPIVLASSALAVLGVGLRADGLRARRAGVVAAFVIALLGLTTCYVGLNLPLWQLAGSISGE